MISIFSNCGSRAFSKCILAYFFRCGSRAFSKCILAYFFRCLGAHEHGPCLGWCGFLAFRKRSCSHANNIWDRLRSRVKLSVRVWLTHVVGSWLTRRNETALFRSHLIFPAFDLPFAFSPSTAAGRLLTWLRLQQPFSIIPI